MAPLDAYLSPQLQQALVGGAFVALGWIVARRESAARDEAQRLLRREDLQRALLAEIRAHVFTLERQTPDAAEAERLIALARAGRLEPSPPRQANDRIYAAVIGDINILPRSVIDPIVLYYRLLAVMMSLAEDMQRAPQKAAARRGGMMADYLLLTSEARDAGLRAIAALTESLPKPALEVDADTVERLRRDLPGELAAMRADLERDPRRINSRSADPRGR